MKQLLLLHIIIAALSTSVQAATITVVADDFLGSFDNFSTSPSGTALSQEELAGIVTDDAATFVLSNDDTASFDLGFGSTKVVTGESTDLVIYTVGNDYNFGLQVFDANDDKISDYLYSVPADGSTTATNNNGSPLCVTDSTGGCAAVISATPIDLLGILDGTEIGFIRLFIGTNEKFKPNAAYPLFSLAGAVHVSAVPLPLPALLLTSGLAMLGWVGRRKRH